MNPMFPSTWMNLPLYLNALTGNRCSEHAGAQLGASEHVHEARLALQSNDLRPQALWAAHI